MNIRLLRKPRMLGEFVVTAAHARGTQVCVPLSTAHTSQNPKHQHLKIGLRFPRKIRLMLSPSELPYKEGTVKKLLDLFFCQHLETVRKHDAATGKFCVQCLHCPFESEGVYTGPSHASFAEPGWSFVEVLP